MYFSESQCNTRLHPIYSSRVYLSLEQLHLRSWPLTGFENLTKKGSLNLNKISPKRKEWLTMPWQCRYMVNINYMFTSWNLELW